MQKPCLFRLKLALIHERYAPLSCLFSGFRINAGDTEGMRKSPPPPAAYVYLMHDANDSCFTVVGAFEPAVELASWGSTYFDLQKSSLLEFAVATDALEFERRFRAHCAAGAATNPAWYICSYLREFRSKVMRWKKKYKFVIGDLLAPRPIRRDPCVPVLGSTTEVNPYLASNPKLVEVQSLLKDLKDRCTVLALLPKNDNAIDFAHQNRRCLVGVYPSQSGARSRFLRLREINAAALPNSPLWDSYKISKVSLFGGQHLKESNAVGVASCELDFKDPLDGAPYLVYGAEQRPERPWLTLPHDSAWYIQAMASRKAHEMLSIPVGIYGWDRPIPADIYEQIALARVTPPSSAKARRLAIGARGVRSAHLPLVPTPAHPAL